MPSTLPLEPEGGPLREVQNEALDQAILALEARLRRGDARPGWREGIEEAILCLRLLRRGFPLSLDPP